GSFDHIQYSCPNVMVPRAVLMKTGLKTVNNARPVNTVRSVNTARPFSTARDFNTVRLSYTAHPKSTVHCARPRTHFKNQAQSTVQRPFYKRTALTKGSNNQNVNIGRQTVNTGRQNVNTIREKGFNVVKPLACWVWKPINPNGASLLILRVKKLEARVKIGKARKRARVVISEDDEDVEDDSSKQGRKLSDAENQESSEKGSAKVSTVGARKGTASEIPIVSTAEENVSTAGRTVTYRRRSEEKRTRKD
ncbi:hypothetical protein Tco_0113062, partial [Tanacetum coccineum]